MYRCFDQWYSLTNWTNCLSIFISSLRFYTFAASLSCGLPDFPFESFCPVILKPFVSFMYKCLRYMAMIFCKCKLLLFSLCRLVYSSTGVIPSLKQNDMSVERHRIWRYTEFLSKVASLDIDLFSRSLDEYSQISHTKAIRILWRYLILFCASIRHTSLSSIFSNLTLNPILDVFFFFFAKK